MNATSDRIRQTFVGRAKPKRWRAATSAIGSRAKGLSWGLVALTGLLALWLLVLESSPALAAVFGAPPVRSLAQIRIDDEGKPLSYPLALAYDPVLEEIYLVHGGTSRVVVYGPDFFPRFSVGPGRGIVAPSSVAVASNGEVYVGQIRNRKNPVARITILNGAFFIDREILLDQIPEAKGFNPKNIALNEEAGFIYLVGDHNRGLMVLDLEGTFLRWIKPRDQVYARNLPKTAEGSDQENAPAAETEEAPPEDEERYADIPEEFRPRTGNEPEVEPVSGKVEGPVLVNFVTLDKNGRIYLLSHETGKVYVYGPDETFLFSFGTKGGSPGQLSQPRAMGIDNAQELIYVADYMRHTVLVYKFDGEYLFELGGRGLEPGWFNFPTAMTMNRFNQFIVADLFNSRVQVLEMAYQAWLRQYEITPLSDGQGQDEAVGEALELTPGTPEPDSGAGTAESQTGGDSGFEIQINVAPEPDAEIEVEMIEEEKLPVAPAEPDGTESGPTSR